MVQYRGACCQPAACVAGAAGGPLRPVADLGETKRRAHHGARQRSHSRSMARSLAEGPPAGGIVAPWSGPAVSSIWLDQVRISSTVSKLMLAGAIWRMSGGSSALWQARHQLLMNGAPKLS